MGENARFVDYYELLAVPTNAGPGQIRVAYIRLAKLHHPDAGGSNSAMQQLNTAYRTLMTSSSRKAYDKLHDFHTGSTVSKYRETGTGSQGEATDDLSDDEIDDFLDSIFAEYHNQPKPKPTLLKKIRELF
jgi:curved DNA-binding protein CbpA